MLTRQQTSWHARKMQYKVRVLAKRKLRCETQTMVLSQHAWLLHYYKVFVTFSSIFEAQTFLEFNQ